MKLEDLKPGVYVLSKDVKNPKPDRRRPDGKYISDWREWVTIPKGTRFKLVEPHLYDYASDEKVRATIQALPAWKRLHLTPYGGGGLDTYHYDLTHAWVDHQKTYRGDREVPWKGEDFFLLMVEALEPAPVTLDVFFSLRDAALKTEAQWVIAALLRRNLITWELLERGIQLAKEDEAEHEDNGLPPLPVWQPNEKEST